MSSPTTGIVLTDLEIAAPSGGVAALTPTTIRYAGTILDNALIPVCFDANIPAPFSIPCFLIVGISFLPVEVKFLDLATFLRAILKPELPDS